MKKKVFWLFPFFCLLFDYAFRPCLKLLAKHHGELRSGKIHRKRKGCDAVGNVFSNGKVYDVPNSFYYNGTTYIPLRFLISTTDLPIRWNQESRPMAIGQGVEARQVSLSDLPTQTGNRLSKAGKG
ncbi:MAG: copper amine oxidase N-terminal domain-containing protein [Candidatus Eremiobacteraeota bacterium]|nr:copper amine oxidase N-terminal domain-containing protein [Candidatus Eremiobacteraeota bacterium]MCL5054829.1 copper amine oxidase N-terminal domain-containing protein [Bacillota bacterium]